VEAVPTDVGERDEVAAFSGAAIERFGRIDTWVNNAGTSIDGPYQDIPVTDQEKLFKTNFQVWCTAPWSRSKR
jgi:short-subunit dehydrogenase